MKLSVKLQVDFNSFVRNTSHRHGPRVWMAVNMRRVNPKQERRALGVLPRERLKLANSHSRGVKACNSSVPAEEALNR
jgi:hypothetical protein